MIDPAFEAGSQSLLWKISSPGGRNSNPLQYACLENPMDGGACQATVHGVTKSQTQLSDFTFTFTQLTSQAVVHLKDLILTNLCLLVCLATIWQLLVS